MNLWRIFKPLQAVLSFLDHRGGNIAMTFALLILPMLGSIGLAVDFGQILTARNKAQVAADAAVLQASGVARDIIEKGTSSDAEVKAAMAEAKKRGEALFAAYAQQSGISNYSINLTVTRDGQVIKASANFSTTTKTTLARIVGIADYTATGSGVSTSSLPNYSDIYLALDVSQSMGLGATQADMLNLYNNTRPQCVFGCHVAEDNQNGISNSDVAAALGIKLRIDVLRDATRAMITEALDGSGNTPIYRFALYTMGIVAKAPTEANLGILSPITDKLQLLKDNVVKNITLGENTTAGYGDSYMNEQLKQLQSKIPATGDGSSQDKARKYLFIVTDGVRDAFGNCANQTHCMGTIDPTVCKSLKAKDIIVGVVYTTYLPVYQNPAVPTTLESNYKNLVVNTGIAPKIAPALESCASSGWFFEASDEAGIKAAMTKLFNQTKTAPALTQ